MIIQAPQRHMNMPTMPWRGQPRGPAPAMPDAITGYQPLWRKGFFGKKLQAPVRGYAYDLNRNGRFDRGQDSVLVFDMNGDGKYSRKEVAATNNMMKAAAGNFDFNGDGKISWKERIMGKAYQKKHDKLDRDRDGRLSGAEIARGGGRLWTDHSRDGQINPGELRNPMYGGGRQPMPMPFPGYNGGPQMRPLPAYPGHGGQHMRPLPAYPGQGGQHMRPM